MPREKRDDVSYLADMPTDDLRPHYDFSYDKTKPNKFAEMELKFKGRRFVFLDEDVAEVFDSSEAVNTVLRSAIKAMRTASQNSASLRPTSKPKES